MILTGEEAKRVYEALGESFDFKGTTVRDGDKLYQVFARPLLPNEFEQLALWFHDTYAPSATTDYVVWPLSSRTFSAGGSMAAAFGGDPDMILTGEEAVRVYAALGETYGDEALVRAGDKWYRVSTKLLWIGRRNSLSQPVLSLSCSPSDGWMQAP